MRKRLGIISLFIMLFIAFIAIWNYSYQTGKEEAYIPLLKQETLLPIIPAERGVFKRFNKDLDYANMPVDRDHVRSLKEYYNNRAYHGAPPSIPHKVISERNMGDNSCLKCHENGGFVEKFKAYAPVSPHPELVNCRQCHVPQKTQGLFKGFTYRKVKTPKAGVNNALVTSPPVIPHQIQLRENCLSCHAGPSAPKEIRVSHPDRINCLQCHVLNNKRDTDIGVFIRAKKNE